MNIESQKNIYFSVLNEVDVILRNLAISSDDRYVSEAKISVMDRFHKIASELKKHIDALEKNAEWDTFSIAFYGETNAGKSTIIEMLRILLAEQSKVKDQQEFNMLQAEHHLTEQRIDQLRAAMVQSDQLCTELNTRQSDLNQKFEKQKNQLHGEIDTLQRFIAEKKQFASIWQKILNRFIKLGEEKQLTQLEIIRQAQSTERGREVELLQHQQLDAHRQKTAQEQEYQHVETKMQHLAEYADGAIIGNGSPDFTRVTKTYQFALAGQKFALLDVPGIEGEEDKVMADILSAVQTAHAVFYVTGKAAPPQKGEEGRKGTLEKIKAHLGAQTEVWTIFNKRVTNPLQLEKADLIGKDEQISLYDLDKKMRDQLGDHYRRTISMSAQPAFLAVAGCLIPGSSNAINKAKFMSRFSVLEILEKSGVNLFRDLLRDHLMKDAKDKIIRSNCNKVNQVIREISAEVAISSKTFKQLGVELKKNVDPTQSQLDNAVEALKLRLESQSERAINDFSNVLRRKIYAEIDKDIGDDDFEHKFKRSIEAGQEALIQYLPVLVTQEVEKFQKEIAKIIERFKEFSSELLEAYGNMRINGLDGNFNLTMEMDNGINSVGLFTALAGALMIFVFPPEGLLLLAIGVVPVIMSVVKSLYGFFDSDYKKSEQRKAVDDNLKTITDKMRESIKINLALMLLQQLNPKIESVKAAIKASAHQPDETYAIMNKFEVELKKISKNMETAEAT
jgi:hypothetical protein